MKGDGVFRATSSNPNLSSWLGAIMVELTFTAKSQKDKYMKLIKSSWGIAVFISKIEDHEHWRWVERSCQRFAPKATALGFKTALIKQLVEGARFRPDSVALVGMPGRRPDFVTRFSYEPFMPYSARRPLEAVLI